MQLVVNKCWHILLNATPWAAEIHAVNSNCANPISIAHFVGEVLGVPASCKLFCSILYAIYELCVKLSFCFWGKAQFAT